MKRTNTERNGPGALARQDVAAKGLALLEEATRMLAEAETLEDIKAIRDKAETARTYARAVNAGLELQNQAAEIKLRAERKAGEFLQSLPLRGGDRRSKAHDEPLKLADLGITRNQSTRWQKEATVPEEVFCEFLAYARENDLEITASRLIRLAGRGSNGHATSTRSRGSRAENTLDVDVIQPDSPESASKLIDELRNQHKSLTQVLAILTDENSETCELDNSDRRLVRYILGQIKGTIDALAKTAT